MAAVIIIDKIGTIMATDITIDKMGTMVTTEEGDINCLNFPYLSENILFILTKFG